jgi:hypothetical protein
MTDRDIVERVGSLWGRAVFPALPRREHYKVPYVTVLKGAPAVTLMKMVRPYMGVSRQEQIDRAIASWHGHRARRAFASPVIDLAHDICVQDCTLTWLAGLLEGEGTFRVTRVDGHCYPVIELKMCDEDVVLRAGAMLGASHVQVRQPKYSRWSVTYVVKISGSAAAETMRVLRDLMGTRRREAIDKALKSYRPIQLIKAPAHCIVAGCQSPHRGRGLCHKHYMSWSRDLAKGRQPRITPLR